MTTKIYTQKRVRIIPASSNKTGHCYCVEENYSDDAIIMCAVCVCTKVKIGKNWINRTNIIYIHLGIRYINIYIYTN